MDTPTLHTRHNMDTRGTQDTHDGNTRDAARNTSVPRNTVLAAAGLATACAPY